MLQSTLKIARVVLLLLGVYIFLVGVLVGVGILGLRLAEWQGQWVYGVMILALLLMSPIIAYSFELFGGEDV